MNRKQCDARALCSCAFAALAVAGLAIPLPAQAPKYVAVDLGTLGGNGTATSFYSSPDVAFGINRLGQVVGTSATAAGDGHAFRTAPNMPINPATDDLGTLGGGLYSEASSVNHSGQATGLSDFPGFTKTRGFRADPGLPLLDLGTLSTGDNLSSNGNGINNAGQVVGAAAAAVSSGCTALGFTFSPSHAFRTAANNVIVPVDDLGTIAGNCRYSVAFAVNSLGVTVGYGAIDNSGVVQHAFRVVGNGPMQDLGTLPGGTNSFANGVNDQGQIVGNSQVTPDPVNNPFNNPHAFFATGATPSLHDIGTLGGTYSSATAINSSSQIVGLASSANDAAFHGFLYHYPTGPMYDLNSLIPAGSGWELSQANSINDAGQIVGQGMHNGLPRAYRLDPLNLAVPNLITTLSSPTLGLNQAQIFIFGTTLRSAQVLVGSGRPAAARAVLTLFIGEVKAGDKAGRIGDANAQSLIATAQAIIASL